MQRSRSRELLERRGGGGRRGMRGPRRWSSSTAAAPAAWSRTARGARRHRDRGGLRALRAGLFDSYRAFPPDARPRCSRSVVRRPGPGHRHGPRRRLDRVRAAGADRLPTAELPAGPELLAAPRAPARCRPRCVGRAADRLRIGDRVWFRHAKAGELCEHVDAAPGRRRRGRGSARPTAARARPSCRSGRSSGSSSRPS